MIYDSGVPGVLTPDEELENKRLAYLDEIDTKVIAGLDREYDLIYVHYDDTFSDEQVGYILEDDYESLWDSMSDWESEGAHHGAQYVLDDIYRDMAREYAEEYRELFDADVCDDYRDAYDDDLYLRIRESESGDWFKQLARNTPAVLCRVMLAESEDWTEESLLSTLGYTPHAENVSAARVMMENAGVGHYGLNLYATFTVDVADMLDLRDDDVIELESPYILLFDSWNGAGFDTKLDGTVRVKRSDIRTDKQLGGYGWDDTAGVSTSAYTVDYRVIKADAAA
jgi:hypothetical protein